MSRAAGWGLRVGQGFGPGFGRLAFDQTQESLPTRMRKADADMCTTFSFPAQAQHHTNTYEAHTSNLQWLIFIRPHINSPLAFHHLFHHTSHTQASMVVNETKKGEIALSETAWKHVGKYFTATRMLGEEGDPFYMLEKPRGTTRILNITKQVSRQVK